MNQPPPEKQLLNKTRITLVYIIIGVVFTYYAFRLFELQIIQGEELAAQADNNRTTNVNIPTTRGLIYDRNGIVLARNIPSYNITITPADLPSDEGAIQEVYRQLSALIDVPVSNGEINEETVRTFKACQTEMGITQIVYIADSIAPYDPVRVKCDVSEEIAKIVLEKQSDWLGVGIEIIPIREYPTGWNTSEIIGFLGPIPASQEDYYQALGFVSDRDKVGYAGIEYSMQDLLGGRNGNRVVEVDVAGKEIRDLEAEQAPIPGSSISLTIDTRLQILAKQALISEISWWNAYLGHTMSVNGVVIAMNPKTGEILSLVSFPSYENNRMTRQIPAYYYQQLSEDPLKPMFNYAISAEQPPGSVFKLATILGVGNENVIPVDKEITCPGKITVMQQFSPNEPGVPRDYVCWTETGHGLVDFVHAIAYSCDIYFYKVSGGYQDEVPQGLGIWKLAEYAKAIGYGNPTGIELPGEASGLIPDPDWKRLQYGENWSTGDTYIAAMGQGFVLATPLQVLTAFSTIINDGVYMKPTIIKEILDADGSVIRPFQPQVVRDVTQDPVIPVFDENNQDTGERKTIDPEIIALAKEGMHMVVLPGGTAYKEFTNFPTAAGKTGTAEYCDDIARSKNLCSFGNWPTHSWFVGYAPYDDPEIAVVAFIYNGGEGASVAAPIVRQILEGYFDLKSMDATQGGS